MPVCHIDGLVLSTGGDVQFPVGFLQCEEHPFAPGCDVCQQIVRYVNIYWLKQILKRVRWVTRASLFSLNIIWTLIFQLASKNLCWDNPKSA